MDGIQSKLPFTSIYCVLEILDDLGTSFDFQQGRALPAASSSLRLSIWQGVGSAVKLLGIVKEETSMTRCKTTWRLVCTPLQTIDQRLPQRKSGYGLGFRISKFVTPTRRQYYGYIGIDQASSSCTTRSQFQLFSWHNSIVISNALAHFGLVASTMFTCKQILQERQDKGDAKKGNISKQH